MTAGLSDPELERLALGACVLRPADQILASGLVEEDFAVGSHVTLWRAILGLCADGLPVDTVSLRSRLLDAGRLEQAGGDEAVLGLTDGAIPSVLPLERLRRLSRLRRIELAARSALAALAELDEGAALSALELGAEETRNAQQHVSHVKTARDMAAEWIDAMGRGDTATISLGLPVFTRVLGRGEPGQMMLIGANTGVGKSTISLEMLIGAVMDGETVGLINVEDRSKLTTGRMLSALCGLSPRKLKYVSREHTVWPSVDRACRAMHEMHDKFLFAECMGMNEQDIMARMSVMAKAGVRIIVVDYIGRVKLSHRAQDRRNEIRIIAGDLKDHALRVGVFLVLVCQLSRPKEDGSKPSLYAFKEASDLEEACDFAVLAWRPVRDDFAPTYFELAKGKEGGTGAQWTMQREIYREHSTTPNGSGRFIEVRHRDQPNPRDDAGNEIWLREVMSDPSGGDRWKP